MNVCKPAFSLKVGKAKIRQNDDTCFYDRIVV